MLQGVLSLCSREEAPPPAAAGGAFPLPAAVVALEALLREGPVYLHCQAGLERSPLVAMAWLMQQRRLDLQAALEYLREVHPASRPQAEQLAALRAWQAGALAA
ncbi:MULTISPECIES: dual specificity protein phosphatase family protein [Aphanothece]|uniref:dual specificity protein phosphatase family protein n=1 Tax=Aphanothece TaxID=1121 RepID=UPI00398527D4